jgi:hypothetical protein
MLAAAEADLEPNVVDLDREQRGERQRRRARQVERQLRQELAQQRLLAWAGTAAVPAAERAQLTRSASMRALAHRPPARARDACRRA